ncbi:type III secretion system protein SpaS [Burkholderia cepacia]|uniref:Secretion apparatus protein BsaZ n=1 Tax=Burkholderia cepacia TaxID=292 RepID=A0A0J5VQ22_BURCE|nr:EscU/YscU/HrcU family type III secretion system export apparatus switch protein [Burkholderia cepacia]KML40112.1 type III secretion system protein SpaS [Burkholderia cepacia]
MSANKTEKPTPKRLRDAGRKGQTFKPKDLFILVLLLCGAAYLLSGMPLTPIRDLFVGLVQRNFDVSPQAFIVVAAETFFRLALPFVGMCVIAGALPSLLLNRFSMATEALKPNLGALNPMKGFKKIFSIRTIKDAVKSVLYLIVIASVVPVFWHLHRHEAYAQLDSTRVTDLFAVWRDMAWDLFCLLLLSIAVVVVLDALAEYFLFMKDMMMDREEIKREYKEQEGNPEVKSRRREVHMEILSEQVKSDVAKSKFIVANPTHISVGIYFNPEIVPLPFVSLMETNQRALAVQAYARKMGVPIIRNVPLARKIFRTTKRYSFVNLDELQEILQILKWLEDVEKAGGVPLSSF